MEATKRAPRKDRKVYATPERAAQRGLKARASASAWAGAWPGVKASAAGRGWCWVAVSDGSWALYVNSGLSRKHRRPMGWSKPKPKTGTNPPKEAPYITLAEGIVAFACLQCGLVDGTLVCREEEVELRPVPTLCPCCKEDSCAIHGLEVQRACGVNLGWTLTETTPFMGDAVGERLGEYAARGQRLSVGDAKVFGVRRTRGT